MIVGVALVGTTSHAGAHSATGTLGIEATPGPAPLTAHVRVLLEYSNDREVAPGASVVARAAGPDGHSVGDTPLTDVGNGVYDGTLTMPAAGSWKVTVTATNPSATADATVAVVAALTPTATTDTIGTSSDAVSKDRGAGTEDDGTSALWIGAVVVVVAAAVTAGVVLVRRRAH